MSLACPVGPRQLIPKPWRPMTDAASAALRVGLGLLDAWPAFPLILPSRDLSKTGWTTLRTVHGALKLNTMLFARATSRTEREERYKAGRLIIRAARSTWKQIRLGVCGNRHQWRLK